MTSNCNHATCQGATCRRPAKAKPPGKPIARESKKRAKINMEYALINKVKLANDALCVVRSPVCTIFAQGQNHIQKRSPKNLTEPDNLENCCNMCNQYLEQYPGWAKKNGHWISRFAK